MHPQAETRKLKLSVTAAANLPTLSLDERRIDQVLTEEQRRKFERILQEAQRQ